VVSKGRKRLYEGFFDEGAAVSDGIEVTVALRSGVRSEEGWGTISMGSELVAVPFVTVTRNGHAHELYSDSSHHFEVTQKRIEPALPILGSYFGTKLFETLQSLQM
jgi:hypothetical protein